ADRGRRHSRHRCRRPDCRDGKNSGAIPACGDIRVLGGCGVFGFSRYRSDFRSLSCVPCVHIESNRGSAIRVVLRICADFATLTLPSPRGRGYRIASMTKEEYFEQAVNAFGEDKLEESIDAYKQALSLDPNYQDALHGLGMAYFNHGRIDDAISTAKKL